MLEHPMKSLKQHKKKSILHGWEQLEKEDPMIKKPIFILKHSLLVIK
jgi:hypothetical protein